MKPHERGWGNEEEEEVVREGVVRGGGGEGRGRGVPSQTKNTAIKPTTTIKLITLKIKAAV